MIKKQSDNTPNDKVDFFRKTVVVIEEELFDAMNLTDVTTFPTALIKYAKTIFNIIIKFPCDTRRHIGNILIKNGCVGTQILSRYCVRNVAESLFYKSKISQWTTITC